MSVKQILTPTTVANAVASKTGGRSHPSSQLPALTKLVIPKEIREEIKANPDDVFVTELGVPKARIHEVGTDKFEVMLAGAKPETADRVKEVLEERFPNAQFDLIEN